MCHQCQRDVTVPALPAPDLVLIPAAIAFGRLEAGLALPALAVSPGDAGHAPRKRQAPPFRPGCAAPVGHAQSDTPRPLPVVDVDISAHKPLAFIDSHSADSIRKAP